MKKLILFVLLSFSISAFSSVKIYPTPQKVTWGVGLVNFDEKSVKTSLDNTLPAEGYVLTVTKDGVSIKAADDRGEFYARQTLAQLIQDGKVREVTIEDYPVVRFRGVVEGFYGKPWSHRDRLAQFKFYGQNKLNTYIYGPKDDPYHSSLSGHADGTQKDSKGGWRVPYPADEAAKIAELARVAKENHVDFVWAIHPGADIKWTEEDFGNLIRKFNSMYDLGVRSFAVFFDDISGEGANAKRQAELLNRINREFVKVKGDVTPLIMCPTEYNKSWANSNMEKSYLVTLGTELDKDVQIMWTGDRVCADITRETLDWINVRIKRPTYIWWNFPVTDYVRHLVVQGPSYGLTKEAKGRMAGFTSNPMENAEASKIALFGVADYTWNPENYDYLAAWEEGIRRIMPQAPEAYRTFAIHSADLEKNGHGFRRDESWQTDVNNIEALKAEFEALSKVNATISASGADEFLVAELKPWLEQAQVVGEKGVQTVELLQVGSTKNPELIWASWLAGDMTGEQLAAYKAHKVGTLKLMPWITSKRDSVARVLYTQLGGTVGKSANAKAKLHTNVARVKSQTVSDVANVVSIAPVLEKMSVEPGGYIGVELASVMTLEKIDVQLPGGSMKRLYSADGKEWTEKATQAKYVIYKNASEKTRSVSMPAFSLSVMPLPTDVSALTDGDLRSAYALPSSITIAVPEGAVAVTVLGEKGTKATVDGVGEFDLEYMTTEIPYGTQEVEISNGTGKVREIIWKIEN